MLKPNVSFMSLTWELRPKHLSHPSPPLHCYPPAAGSEVVQPGHEPTLVRDARIFGYGFASYFITLGPILNLLMAAIADSLTLLANLISEGYGRNADIYLRYSFHLKTLGFF